MTLREAWKRDKFKGVWRWATRGKGPRPGRWERVVEWSRNRVNQFKKGVRESRRRLSFANEHIKKRKEEREDLKRQLKRAESLGHEEQAGKIKEELAQNHRSLKDLRKYRRRLLDQKKHRIDQVKFWINKNTIYRKKHKAAVKNAEQQQQQQPSSPSQPTFQPYMANGYNWVQCNTGIRNACARWVVLDGNYTTSLFRDFVPPGGSTTSYHLQGKAGDCGPSRTTQVREYNRNLGNPNCLELFGPDNTLWIKYGADTGGAEGTALENLHDTHNHQAYNV
jgi:hypothetical protein